MDLDRFSSHFNAYLSSNVANPSRRDLWAIDPLQLHHAQVVAVSPRLLERNNPDFVALVREVVMLNLL